MMRVDLRAACAATIVWLAVPAAMAADKAKAAAPQASSDTSRQLDLFGEVFERVRADYVEEVSDEQLVEAAINGMLSALDPHSSYMNAKNFRDMQVQVRGEFGGLGIEVTMENGLVKVVSPIDDTPAARGGLKPGDFITHIDGEAVAGLSLHAEGQPAPGPVDTDIQPTNLRRGPRPLQGQLAPAILEQQAVESDLDVTDLGYI